MLASVRVKMVHLSQLSGQVCMVAKSMAAGMWSGTKSCPICPAQPAGLCTTSGRSSPKKPSSPMDTRWLLSRCFTKLAISSTQARKFTGQSGTCAALQRQRSRDDPKSSIVPVAAAGLPKRRKEIFTEGGHQRVPGALADAAGLLGEAHKRAWILVHVSKAHDLNAHMPCLQLKLMKLITA